MNCLEQLFVYKSKLHTILDEVGTDRKNFIKDTIDIIDCYLQGKIQASGELLCIISENILDNYKN